MKEYKDMQKNQSIKTLQLKEGAHLSKMLPME